MKTVAAYTTSTWISPLAVLRLTAPLQQAGIALLHGSDLNAGLGDLVYPGQVDTANAVIIQRDFPAHPACRAIVERTRAQGKPLIFELDDLLFALPPEHPDRRSGYYTPALLPMLNVAANADLITVSNAFLGEMLRPFNPNIALLPNYLDDSIWSLRAPRPPRPDGKVVIGYMGGETHRPDLELIAPALLNLAQRFAGRVIFDFLGAPPPAALKNLPNVRWQPVKTMDYALFAADFLQQEYDLALAPLRDSTFNRCKSAIKFLEYTALGVPGVYSPLEPYTAIVRDGETGLFAPDLAAWETQLSQLIEDPNLRQRIARQAQADVRQHWLLSNNAWRWRDALESAASRARSRPSVPASSLLEAVAQQIGEWQENQAQQLAGVTTERDAARQAFQTTGARLNEIESSTAWKLVRRLWDVQVALRGRKPASIPAAIPIPAASPSAPAAPAPLEIIAPAPAENPRLWQKHSSQYDVILFPVMDWASRVQRPQQIAWQFARTGQRVFYIHPIFRLDGRAAVKLIEENIYEVHLPAAGQINIYQEAMPDGLAQALAEGMAQVRAAFGIAEAISMVDLPFWTPLALRLRQQYAWKMVYDCMDYHRGFSSNADPMLALEDTLVRQSDLIVVASYPMRDLLSPLNPHIVLAPNGADFEHFRFGRLAAPPSMANLPRPIIGYFGAISDWFDAERVRDLAQARPNWSFVLIGSTLYGNEEILHSQPNIHLLGEKPYAELPAHLHAFDVAIIPLKKTPLTQLANQLKLFEYLSAGKSVVSTDLNDMLFYTEQARLAATVDEWLAGIDAALTDIAPECVQARQDFARRNTWEHRLAAIQAGLHARYPLASVIISTPGDLDTIRLCLHSIFSKTDYPNYEVIVAPTDDTAAALQALAASEPRLKLSANPIRSAAGETLVFLDGGSVVTYGWLSGLLRHLRAADVGLVAPATNTPGETGVAASYPSLQQMDDFAARRASDHFGKSTPLTAMPSACYAVRRSASFGSPEEFRAHGLRLMCAQDVFIHLWGQDK